MRRLLIPQPEESLISIIPKWAAPVVELVFDRRVPYWCQLPYPGHPKGCPNFGKRPKNCSPQAPHVTKLFNVRKPMFLVWSEFDLAAHAARMKAKHPKWSDRQCRCALYWQEGSKKQARERSEYFIKFILKDKRYVAHHMSHAAGVQLYATWAAAGVPLQRIRDITINRHVSLVGVWLGGKNLLGACKH